MIKRDNCKLSKMRFKLSFQIQKSKNRGKLSNLLFYYFPVITPVIAQSVLDCRTITSFPNVFNVHNVLSDRSAHGLVLLQTTVQIF